MLIVALALVGVLAATVVCFANLMRSQQRSHARREDLLVAQLLHAAGNPWRTPPIEVDRVEARAAAAEPHEPEAPRYTATPEAFEPFDDPYMNQLAAELQELQQAGRSE